MKSRSNNTVTLSSKHQVVVPAEIRQTLGVAPGEKMTWLVVDGAVHLIPYKPASAFRGLLKGLSSTDIPFEPDRF
jgi:AbrB family looped-hinge helix DNA binding protein